MALREGITQLKDQLVRLLRSPKNQEIPGDIFMATADVPALGVQYARLLRDLKVQETLFELLIQQFEIVKISEAKNISTIQVLDKGVEADKKSKPLRSLIVLLATFIMGFFAILYAFIREYGQRMGAEDCQLWNEVKQNMKLRGLSKK